MHNIIKSNVKSYKPLRTAIKYMFTVTLSIILIQTFIKANNNENNKKNPALFRVFNSLHALGSMLYYYTLPSGLFLHVHWLEICNKTDIYKKRKKIVGEGTKNISTRFGRYSDLFILMRKSTLVLFMWHKICTIPYCKKNWYI